MYIFACIIVNISTLKKQKISFMADVDDEDFSISRETAEGEESDEEIEVTAAEVLERLEEVKLESF